MKNNRFLPSLILVLILVLSGLGFLLFKQNQSLSEIINFDKTLQTGDNAPLFKEKSLSGDLISIKGKTSLLVFFNATCNSCAKNLPVLRDAYENLRNDGIDVIGIISEKKETADNYVNQRKLQFPVIADPKKKIFTKYKVHYVPLMVLINKKGEIRFYQSYGINIKQSLQKIAELPPTM